MSLVADPIEITMSRAYALRLTEDTIGNQRAVAFAMVHRDAEGAESIRGGFKVHCAKVHELLNALALFR